MGHELLIKKRVGVIGLFLEHTLIGRDCLLQAAASRQRVAQVVLPPSVVQGSEGFDRSVEVTSPVGGDPTPTPIFEIPDGGCVLTLGEGRGAALVRAREPVGHTCLDGLGLHG